MFRKKVNTVYEYLIVGLGNPGDKYEYTRHNAGFLAADRLADLNRCKIKKLRGKALYGEAVIGGARCIIAKPQTYMNNSGESVRALADFWNIPVSNIIAILDETALEIGKIRIRRAGSHGGHNGMKSIVSHLNSEEFIRIRIGVGGRPHPDYDLADWVLSRFKKSEEVPLASAIDDACKAVELIIKDEIDRAMNLYN